MAKTVVFVQGGRANEASYPWRFFHFAPTTEPSPESDGMSSPLMG